MKTKLSRKKRALSSFTVQTRKELGEKVIGPPLHPRVIKLADEWEKHSQDRIKKMKKVVVPEAKKLKELGENVADFVLVVGSTARKEARETSDVDMVFLWKDGTHQDFDSERRLSRKEANELLIKPSPASQSTYRIFFSKEALIGESGEGLMELCQPYKILIGKKTEIDKFYKQVREEALLKLINTPKALPKKFTLKKVKETVFLMYGAEKPLQRYSEIQSYTHMNKFLKQTAEELLREGKLKIVGKDKDGRKLYQKT